MQQSIVKQRWCSLRFGLGRRPYRFTGYAAMVLAFATIHAPGALAGGAINTRYNDINSIMARAVRGNAEAQARLGWLYSIGRGVPQSYYEAAKWYFRAADQGEGEAQRALGMLYNKGEGVPKDLMLSYMWLSLSASHGADRDFRARLRDAIASKMTAQQVQIAQGMTLDWYKAR
jgi:TPR repeat protein